MPGFNGISRARLSHLFRVLRTLARMTFSFFWIIVTFATIYFCSWRFICFIPTSHVAERVDLSRSSYSLITSFSHFFPLEIASVGGLFSVNSRLFNYHEVENFTFPVCQKHPLSRESRKAFRNLAFSTLGERGFSTGRPQACRSFLTS